MRLGEWSAPDIPPLPHEFPVGLEDATQLGNVTRGLLARGYGADEVRKILGGNWLRLFETVWGA
jgi:membrane dipeptidase